MKIEVHKLRRMGLIIPTVGFDTEYRCVFFAWLNKVLYIGKGKIL